MKKTAPKSRPAKDVDHLEHISDEEMAELLATAEKKNKPQRRSIGHLRVDDKTVEVIRVIHPDGSYGDVHE